MGREGAARDERAGGRRPDQARLPRALGARLTDVDTWEGERERLLNGAGEADRLPVERALAAAAAAADAGRLSAAADHLETIRSLLVEHGLFSSWDEGILVFSSLIRIVRRRSPETAVPPAYQRLLDAIPSLKMNEEMSAAQREFWYGSPKAPVGGVIATEPARSKGCAALILVGAALAVALTRLV